MRSTLRARFGWAGLVILLAVVITGVWSTVLFIRLGNVVDRTLQGRQGIIDLTAVMSSALEREDDALLLGVAGEVARARAELAVQRSAFDRAAAELSLQVTPVERAVVASILADVAVYRREGDALLAEANTADARDRYHREVNPLLRRAVAGCGTLREHSFEALRDAGIAARDEARQGRWLVGIVAVGALGLTLLVALALARSVLRPIRDLTASVDAMRRGDFTQHVTRHRDDELGNLAGGFNRMAESLVAWESSNLAEVLRAKDTLEVTIAALPDPVIVVDPDGAVVSLNAPARTVLAAAGSPSSPVPRRCRLPPRLWSAPCSPARRALIPCHRLSSTSAPSAAPMCRSPSRSRASRRDGPARSPCSTTSPSSCASIRCAPS